MEIAPSTNSISSGDSGKLDETLPIKLGSLRKKENTAWALTKTEQISWE